MPLLFTVLTLVMIASAFALVLIILVQRPQGGGLAQAFGGAGGGGTDTAFGGRTGDVLTVGTWIAASFFVVVAVLLNVVPSRATVVPATDASMSAPAGETTLPGQGSANPIAPAPITRGPAIPGGTPNAPRSPGTEGVRITEPVSPPTAAPVAPAPTAAPAPVSPAGAAPTAPPAPAPAPSNAPAPAGSPAPGVVLN